MLQYRCLKKSKSRKHSILLLQRDLATLNVNNQFVMSALFDIFHPIEAREFLKANQNVRPLSIRVNTIKSSPVELAVGLVKKGVRLKPIGKWSRVCLSVKASCSPIAVTPEYLAGHFTIQDATSLLPCVAIQPHQSETIVDMSAAHGGKTTYLAALMENKGIIFANDSSESTLNSVIKNLQRMGVKNTIVCNYDGVYLSRFIGENAVDRVLLDAPSSGLGVLSKNSTIKKKQKQGHSLSTHKTTETTTPEWN
jgi:ribosomal RNA methyltransferase Nop2